MSMSKAFLSLRPEDRKFAFDDAALRLGMAPVILEKDFWVSWLLGLLFAQPELAPHLVFKGGTSLSKVFGVIDRFSEDIDLCLVPEFVGADAVGFDELRSRVKRDAALMEMQRLCGLKVQDVVAPLLEEAIAQALGAPSSGAWLHYELDTDAKSPVLYFGYPSTQAQGFEYVRREVKLELGTLTDQQPTGRYPLRPLLADAYPALFADWTCDVTALELQRTFWEKATILHSEFFRPEGSATPDRYARHYFDMRAVQACLLQQVSTTRPLICPRRMRSNTALTCASGCVSVRQRSLPAAASSSTARMSSRVPTDEPTMRASMPTSDSAGNVSGSAGRPTTDRVPPGARHLKAVS